MNDVKISFKSHRRLGRCYDAVVYSVDSPRPLTPADWELLRASKKLGYGQEFYTRDLGLVDGLHRYEAEDRCDSGD